MKTPKAARRFAAMLGLLLALPSFVTAAVIGSSLQAKLATAAPADAVGLVIVSFHDNDAGLTGAHLDVLRGLGITAGQRLPHLGMVAFPATAAHVRTLAGHAAVRSIFLNEKLHWTIHQGRVLTGIERVETYAPFTAANGGLPLSGKGNFSVVINDSGIDATHADLMFGEHVIQNVQIVTDANTPNSVVEVDPSLHGFTPLGFVENVPNTDTHIGHGTHCAGIVGGNGVRSGGKFMGVAPGAKLIGTGSGAVQYILAALGGFEWTLANRVRYNIRVISNSWGSSGPFAPDDPINIASKRMNDRNIVVVFAAGNEGPGPDSHNPYAKAPWVISVAAGRKEGGLASFSSRGTPQAQRLANSDPSDDFDAPTITAPGAGREFETNAAKFTSFLVATRSSSNVVANGLTSDLELMPAEIPFYTQIHGTSMACPHIAGVVALLLEANSTLSPAQVKSILTATATKMPGYDEWEVGAGFVNAFAAVDKARNLAAPYAPFGRTNWIASVSYPKDPTESFMVQYDPAATPGPDSSNAHAFTVAPGLAVLEVTMEYARSLEAALGNILILRLYAPDGTTYTNAGSVVFVTDEPKRYLKITNPQPGTWIAEARGARGLAAAPQVSSPTALALPDDVLFSVDRSRVVLPAISDIAGNPHEADIRTALSFRYVDLASAGRFQPATKMTRLEFARLLGDNTPLRQSTGAAALTDVADTWQALTRAVVAPGATLRHFDFSVAGLLDVAGAQFKPNAHLTRLDVAIALVRALGYDAQGRALASAIVTAKDSAGNTVAIADLLDVPASLRGYAQLALDTGFVTPKFTSLGAPLFTKEGTVTRAEMAAGVVAYRDFFSLQ